MGLDNLLFVLVGLVGSMASAIFGFGTALLVLAVGSHILPIKEAIALAAVLFVASTVTKTVLFSRHIDWRTVGVMALGCLPFAYLGAELLAIVPADLIKRLLGLMILTYLGLSLTNRLPTYGIGTAGLIGGSALYGLASGLLGSGNVIKVIIFREMKITKGAFVGAMAATSVISNLAKLTSYARTGLLTADMAWPAIALVFCAVGTAFLGRAILKKLDVRAFELGVQILLGMAAAALII